MKIAALMYHEIKTEGVPLVRPNESGYTRYCVTADDFRRQLALMSAQGQCGVNVTETLKLMGQTPAVTDERSAIPETIGNDVCLTFDDGCETDLTIAAPLLKEFGCGATFYAVANLVGQRGYMSQVQLRELSDAGFEIGCHSMTHAYLSDLDGEGLQREIVRAKDELEAMLGKPVNHFSCPGGRWSPRVAAVAQAAGYSSVATSRIGINHRRTNPFALRRVALKHDTTLEDFGRACRGEGMFAESVQVAAMNAAKRLVGNRNYERLRAAVLGDTFEG